MGRFDPPSVAPTQEGEYHGKDTSTFEANEIHTQHYYPGTYIIIRITFITTTTPSSETIK